MDSVGRYEAISVLLLVTLSLITMTAIFLHALFLHAQQECLEKVSPPHRSLPPSKVWLGAIPGFHLIWNFIVANKLSESVQREQAARRDSEQSGDSARKLGLTYAAVWLMTPFLVAASVLLASFVSQNYFSRSWAVWTELFLPLIGLFSALPLLAVWIWYWKRITALTKDLNRDSDALFAERYNSRLELPTGIGLASLMGTVLFVIFVGLLAVMVAPDQTPVPISFAGGGEDDFGMGSPGEGGKENPDAIGDTAPQQQDFAQLPLPTELPKIQEEITKSLSEDDLGATTPVSEEKSASYGALSEDLRNKLLNLGQKKGTGNGTKGGDGSGPGGGPGGTGADSTRARSLRWVLRFKTNNGRDYLNQLHALKAVVMVPKPPDNKQAYIFRDLVNPRVGPLVTEPEWQQLSRQIQFCDFKRESVIGIRDALGLDFTPNSFWAFFPKELEAELSRLEVSYRGRRPENIEETVFQVTIRDGRYQMVVVDQKEKRR